MRVWLLTGLFCSFLSYAQACGNFPLVPGELVYSDWFGTSGLWAMGYDLDQDGYPDVILAYQASSGKPLPFPLFYLMGVDRQGNASSTFRDTGGAGRCEDIRLYWSRESLQLTTP